MAILVNLIINLRTEIMLHHNMTLHPCCILKLHVRPNPFANYEKDISPPGFCHNLYMCSYVSAPLKVLNSFPLLLIFLKFDQMLPVHLPVSNQSDSLDKVLTVFLCVSFCKISCLELNMISQILIYRYSKNARMKIIILLKYVI